MSQRYRCASKSVMSSTTGGLGSAEWTKLLLLAAQLCMPVSSLCSPLIATISTRQHLVTPAVCCRLQGERRTSVALFPFMSISVYAGLSLMRSCHPTSIFTNLKHLPARLGHLLVPQARAQALLPCLFPRQTCPQVSFPSYCFIACVCVGILLWLCCGVFQSEHTLLYSIQCKTDYTAGG